jgi:serine/threonine-protein kinase
MDLLEGETVEARARRTDKRLDIADTLWIGHSMLEVLVAAHDAGIIHRDLKPENLFLTRAGELKILDFGIARLRELSTRSGATGSQSSLGTPAFMPPEQARGRWQEVDARSDLWAVGATMFTLITGRQVHEASTVNEQLLAAMTEPAPTLTSVLSAAPPAVAALIDKALAFKTEDRWQDARSMRAACADAFASASGRSIAEESLSRARGFDETVPVDEKPPTSSAGVRISPPTLTTGRPVASVAGYASSGKRAYALFYPAAAAALALGAFAALRPPPRAPATAEQRREEEPPVPQPSVTVPIGSEGAREPPPPAPPPPASSAAAGWRRSQMSAPRTVMTKPAPSVPARAPPASPPKPAQETPAPGPTPPPSDWRDQWR